MYSVSDRGAVIDHGPCSIIGALCGAVGLANTQYAEAVAPGKNVKKKILP